MNILKIVLGIIGIYIAIVILKFILLITFKLVVVGIIVGTLSFLIFKKWVIK